MGYWQPSHRADPRALPLADRHYNRQKPGTPQFVPPGRCHVLLSPDADALWVTSYPYAEYVKHAWAGAWVNSLFRNESKVCASRLIEAAVAQTLCVWAPPPQGIVSFVDPRYVPPTRRRLPHPSQYRHYFEFEGRTTLYGYCYLQAGWRHVGYTKAGLWTWRQLPSEMPVSFQQQVA